MTKDYGKGEYVARRITDNTILIQAHGFAPATNTIVTLERMPWRIWPPHYGLFFEQNGIGGSMQSPFHKTLVDSYPVQEEFDVVNIVDLSGVIQVPIEAGLEFSLLRSDIANDIENHFAVWQQIGVNSNCVIAPINAIMPAIYFNATAHLGGLTLKQAEKWKKNNCGQIKK